MGYSTQTQVHDYNYLNELLCLNNPDRPKLSDDTKAVTPPVLRPLVAVHPESGKETLYVYVPRWGAVHKGWKSPR